MRTPSSLYAVVPFLPAEIPAGVAASRNIEGIFNDIRTAHSGLALKLVYLVKVTQRDMSSSENGQTPAKYVFKCTFGAGPSSEQARSEPSKAEIDAFVREMLGVLGGGKEATACAKQFSGP